MSDSDGRLVPNQFIGCPEAGGATGNLKFRGALRTSRPPFCDNATAWRQLRAYLSVGIGANPGDNWAMNKTAPG
jgi:hypothetical protein